MKLSYRNFVLGLLTTATLISATASRADEIAIEPELEAASTVEIDGQSYEFSDLDELAILIDSASVQVEDPDLITPRGISFGRRIYIRMSKSNAKAMANGSLAAAGAAVVIGARNPMALAAVAGVVAWAASKSSDYFEKCNRWEFQVNYNMRVHKVQCTTKN